MKRAVLKLFLVTVLLSGCSLLEPPPLIAPGVPLPPAYGDALAALQAHGYQVVEKDAGHITVQKTGRGVPAASGVTIYPQTPQLTRETRTFEFTNGVFNGGTTSTYNYQYKDR